MKWLVGFFVVILAAKLVSQTPRPLPVINLDAGPHTITQNIFCGPSSLLSIDTYVDGVFQFTTYLPPAPPTSFGLIRQQRQQGSSEQEGASNCSDAPHDLEEETKQGCLVLSYMSNFIENGSPCEHPGCLSRVIHPCKGCGRIAGRGRVVVLRPDQRAGLHWQAPVYVDELFTGLEHDRQAARVGSRHGHQWCHLWSEDLEALHAMAAKIGMKQQWFQNRKGFPHYDLVPTKRAAAIRLGAVERSLRDYLREKSGQGLTLQK